MPLVLAGGERCVFLPVTNGTTPTIGAAAFTLTQQVTTSITKDDSGIPTVSIEHTHDDSAYYTFLESAQNLSASANTEELVYEAGTKVTASSAGQAYLLIVKGGTVSGGSDAGKRKVWAGLVGVSNASGSYEQSADTYTRPSLECTGIAASGTVTIASTLLTDYMTTPATITIPSTLKYGKVFFG